MRAQSVLGIAPNRLPQAMSAATSVMRASQNGLCRTPSLAATGRRAELSALDDGVQEAMDARKAAQAAEAGMDGIAKVLDEAISLTKLARNDTLTTADRGALQARLDGVVAALGQVAQDTAFGHTKLLDGSIDSASANGGLTYRPAGEGRWELKLTIEDLSPKGLDLEGLDLSTQEGSEKAADAVRLAVDKVQTQRASLTRFSASADESLKIATAARSSTATLDATAQLDLDSVGALSRDPLIGAGLALASVRANADMVSRLLG